MGQDESARSQGIRHAKMEKLPHSMNDRRIYCTAVTRAIGNSIDVVSEPLSAVKTRVIGRELAHFFAASWTEMVFHWPTWKQAA